MTDVPGSRTLSRAWWLDAARGLAVVAMVAYHLAWDLSHFGVIVTDVVADPAWRLFAKAIAASFLLIAGLSLAFATREGVRWPAVLRRIGIISAAALAVTVVTYVSFPDRFIFFGILHAIAVSSLIALALRRLPAGVVALCGVVVLLLPRFVQSELFDASGLVWLGLGTTVPLTNDFEPVFPWTGWMLLGLALGRSGLLPASSKDPGRTSLLVLAGRWSLVIYLVHQPILFTLVGQMAGRGWLPLAGQEARFTAACTDECGVGGAPEATCRAVCACAVESLRADGGRAAPASGKGRSELSSAVQSCFRRHENLPLLPPKS